MSASRWLVLAMAGLVGLGLYSTMKPQPTTPETASVVDPADGLQVSETESVSASQDPAVQPTDSSDTSRLPIPPSFRFAGIDSVPIAESWEDLLGDYSTEEREQIEAFSSGLNPVAYQFSGPDEQEWLIKQAFPMPDEILAASVMGE